jgi:hypothetical protein
MKLRRQLATSLSALIGPREVPAESAAPAVPAPPATDPPATEEPRQKAAQPIALAATQEPVVRELLETCARSFVGPGRHVRANMMMFSPDGTRRRVHAATAYNMEYDPDRDLEVGATAAASGKAVTERRAAVADLVLLQITAEPAWGMQAAEQAQVRPTLKSILSVPIFNPEDVDGPLLGTLQVDSDLTVEEAGFNRPESSELLQQFADVLSLVLVGMDVRVGDVQAETHRMGPTSRVQNASQVEPGLYVANRSTSIFQLSRSRHS